MGTLLFALLLSPVCAQADPPAQPKKPERQLVCTDAQAIRDFKDVVYGKLNPSRDPDVALKWAYCLCGKAAAEAGVNPARPEQPEATPAIDAYFVERHELSLRKWKAWFKRHLPVDDEQAEMLAQCTCRDVQLCEGRLSKKKAGKKPAADPVKK